MNETIQDRAALRQYSAGAISAGQAADKLGHGATVADVYVLTLEAGLPLPRPPPEQEQAELARAVKLLGL